MISDTIKQLRKRNYLTQADFAKRIGVTQGTVSQWEHGLTAPNSSQLRSISEAFGLSIDFIVGDAKGSDLDLSGPEYRLILAYRKADKNICDAALTMLENSASKKSAEAI